MGSPDHLLSQDGPRNIAEFEAWCKAARKRLQKLLEFEEDLGEDACKRHAADLVARAGDFGLAFPHTLCRPREAMELSEAIESIEACLSWCSRNLVADEAGLKAFTDRLDEFAESFKQIRADLGLLKQQRTLKDAKPPSEYLSINDAATVAGLSPTKIRREIKAGRLAASDTGTDRHPHYRIARSHFASLDGKEQGREQSPAPESRFQAKDQEPVLRGNIVEVASKAA